jgi:SAM-dependent methyltransferase
MMLAADDYCLDLGESIHATALAAKPAAPGALPGRTAAGGSRRAARADSARMSDVPDEKADGVFERAAEKWDTVVSSGHGSRLWQEVGTIRRHLNKRLCGKPLDGFNAGLNHRLARALDGKPAKRAVSVGAGAGAKESVLMRHGLAEHFDLFDISPKMRERAAERVEELGFADRVAISGEDAFEVASGPYDLVHWNSALHHMLDTRAALEWSHRVLAPGGILYMREYVGPDRFEWTERQVELANRFRRALPERFRRVPEEPERLRARKVRPIDPEVTRASDPTESADSANIMPALLDCFPEARVWELGGVIYHIGLTHLIENFDEERDADWLQMALVADDYCIDLGESIHAAALAVKPV